MAQEAIVKTNHTVVTSDKWRLHLVRTQAAPGTLDKDAQKLLPVILIPGLCSSGTFCFDLSPAVSLADWLAHQGWDVWTAELRGNGLSDKPGLFGPRSHYWTIDDLVDLDMPAVISYVCMEAGCTAAHCVGHSMGGMILTGVLSKGGPIAQRIRSATIVGSSCFLEGSWWAVLERTLPAVRLVHSVPAGTTLRLYSQLAFTRWSVPALDILYFWPTNTDPALARALLARNFSATSPGVILQLRSAFKGTGLCTSDSSLPYADPTRLATVHTPVLFLMGDKDKMCPPQGAAKQYDMLTGSVDRQLRIFGPPPRPGRRARTPPVAPNTHTRQHYGHFDILMGKHAVEEVFPHLHTWLSQHDGLMPTSRDSAAAAGVTATEAQAADQAAIGGSDRACAWQPDKQDNTVPQQLVVATASAQHSCAWTGEHLSSQGKLGGQACEQGCCHGALVMDCPCSMDGCGACTVCLMATPASLQPPPLAQQFRDARQAVARSRM